MTSRADRVRELFQEALDREESSRAAFLDGACGDDSGLRGEVDGLLAALAQATGFLTEARAPVTEAAGTLIDRYRLIEPLGEGGFGVVWRAEQQAPLRREVALKVLKLGMDTRRVVARFEHERAALARMDHPHIASVFDGGTTPSGRPYFVMEFVRGEPIDRFCRSHGLGIEERIALLRDVCLAVQHAHLKGVVHRDLKPHNILVGEADGRPVPKVIDFGIAKALETGTRSAASFTMTGGEQMVGTLEYMAPEQASDSADVDSRADVYSLGVVLYELLSGRRPFERADRPTGGVVDLLQRLRSEDPSRPSARAAEIGSEPPLPGADRGRWSRRLRGELDWITARALAKDPALRYATPGALADELQRFLDDRPVDAGPPTTTYQLQRFIGRHRLAVGAALLVIASLLGGVITTSLALTEARDEAGRRKSAETAARSEATRAARALAATRELLLAADPMLQKGPDYTVRQMLDDFAPSVDLRFADDPLVAQDLHVTIGASYRSLGQLEAARRHLESAVELARVATGGVGPAYELALMEWSWVLREEARYPECMTVLEQTMALLRARAAEGPDRVRILVAMADVCRLSGRPEQGESLAIEALDRLGEQSEDKTTVQQRALALDLRGTFAAVRGETNRARQFHLGALALRERVCPKDHPSFAISYTNLAAVERDLGHFDAAEKHLDATLAIQRKAFGDAHPTLAATLAFLAELRRRQHRFDDARALAEQAFAMRQATLPEGHPDLGSSLADLGSIALASDDLVGAESRFREALAIRRARPDPATQAAAANLQNLGVAVDRQGRHAEAESLYREALAIHLRIRGEQHPAVSDSYQNIAIALEGQDRFMEAAAMHERALALRTQYEPDNHVRQAASCVGIARAHENSGEFAAAGRAQVLRASLLADSPGTEPEQLAAIRSRAARLFLRAGAHAEATPLLESVLTWCTANMPDQWPTAECASMLSECRLAEGRRDDAVRLARDGWSGVRNSSAPADRKRDARDRLVAALEARAIRHAQDGDQNGAAGDRQAAAAVLAEWNDHR